MRFAPGSDPVMRAQAIRAKVWSFSWRATLTGAFAWGTAKLLDYATTAINGPSITWLHSSDAALWFIGFGILVGLSWAVASSRSTDHPTKTSAKNRRGSTVTGEIVLFEQLVAGNHPELYAHPEPDGITKALKYGASFEVGLHIENLGKATRLRDWVFRIETTGGPDVTPVVDPNAWPPPGEWHKNFPLAMTLASVGATYIEPARVYVVYCRVRIKSFRGEDYKSYLKLDSFEASATDSEGRTATFRISKNHAAFS